MDQVMILVECTHRIIHRIIHHTIRHTIRRVILNRRDIHRIVAMYVRCLRKTFTDVPGITKLATHVTGTRETINVELSRPKQDAVEYATLIVASDREVVTTITGIENAATKDSTNIENK